jgi:hypothetical protein
MLPTWARRIAASALLTSSGAVPVVSWVGTWGVNSVMRVKIVWSGSSDCQLSICMPVSNFEIK